LVHLDPTGNGVPPHGKHPPKNAANRNAVLPLANAVRAHDAEVRVAAIHALAGMGENARPAVPALAAALGDTDTRVRCAAAEALGQLGPAAHDAVPDLNLAVKDSDIAVRRAASDALLRITQPIQP
jgi:HEAT repeat protein